MWYDGWLMQVEVCMGAKDLAGVSIQPICIKAQVWRRLMLGKKSATV